MSRYERNAGAFPADGQARLQRARVAIVGLGGLGGLAAELLARAGVGMLVLVDGDRVSEGNLNRQLFATEGTVGLPKVEAARARLQAVNGAVRLAVHREMLDARNGGALLEGADAVVDALDNREGRLHLAAWCDRMGLPLVHGAVRGWLGQVSVIEPGTGAMARLYPAGRGGPPPSPPSVPPFAAAMVASVQAAQAARLLMGMDGLLTGKLLMMDMASSEYRTIQIAD